MKKAAPGKTTKKRVSSGKGFEKPPLRSKSPKASTIRLRPELQTALDRVSKHLDRPKNKIVNQAVAEYLEKTSLQLRDDIEGTLANLRVYRAKDPNFEAGIERFAAAETAESGADTHEGKELPASKGSLLHDIQEVIHA